MFHDESSFCYVTCDSDIFVFDVFQKCLTISGDSFVGDNLLLEGVGSENIDNKELLGFDVFWDAFEKVFDLFFSFEKLDFWCIDFFVLLERGEFLLNMTKFFFTICSCIFLLFDIA